MSNDISIKCEVLGRAYDAPVIAIGARAFDITTGKLGEKLYVEVALDSTIKTGRVDGATLARWITRSDRAKKIFSTEDKDKPSLATALLELQHWCRGSGKGTNQQSGPITPWAQGATADITWLEHAYTVGGHGLTLPWAEAFIRDGQTLVSLATSIAGFDQGTVKHVGASGNAVDDATYHANVFSAAFKALSSYNPQQRMAAALAKVDDDDEL